MFGISFLNLLSFAIEIAIGIIIVIIIVGINQMDVFFYFDWIFSRVSIVVCWEFVSTLSRGRAGPAWPEGRPGPTPKGPGLGQNFGHLARPPWGQGPKHLTWPDLAQPGPTLSEIQFTVKFLKVERGPSHCLYFLNFISLYLEVLLI